MDNNKKEIWKSIEGYEGIYEISNTRKIKSLKRISDNGRYIREKILKFCKNGKYDVVTLRKNNKAKNFYVDKLMYTYFKI